MVIHRDTKTAHCGYRCLQYITLALHLCSNKLGVSHFANDTPWRRHFRLIDCLYLPTCRLHLYIF